MKRCPELDKLPRALGEELSGEERHALQEHLAACPACRREWRKLTRVGDVLSEAFQTATTPR